MGQQDQLEAQAPPRTGIVFVPLDAQMFGNKSLPALEAGRKGMS